MCITCAAAARRRRAARRERMNTFDPYAYLDAAAAAVDLPVPAAYRDGVAANLARLHAMAADVIDFPRPAPADPALAGGDDTA